MPNISTPKISLPAFRFALITPVIKYLLITNIAIFALQDITRTGEREFYIWFDHVFAFWPVQSGNFYPWQLITHSFLHANFTHVASNMIFLWVFGVDIEHIWGSVRFIFFYLLCGLGAAVADQAFCVIVHDPRPMIGASGAIFGVVVAYAMMFPERKRLLYFFPFRLKGVFAVTVMILYEVFASLTISHVAHFAHIGGAVTGLLYIFYLDKYPVEHVFGKIIAQFKRNMRSETLNEIVAASDRAATEGVFSQIAADGLPAPSLTGMPLTVKNFYEEEMLFDGGHEETESDSKVSAERQTIVADESGTLPATTTGVLESSSSEVIGINKKIAERYVARIARTYAFYNNVEKLLEVLSIVYKDTTDEIAGYVNEVGPIAMAEELRSTLHEMSKDDLKEVVSEIKKKDLTPPRSASDDALDDNWRIREQYIELLAVKYAVRNEKDKLIELLSLVYNDPKDEIEKYILEVGPVQSAEGLPSTLHTMSEDELKGVIRQIDEKHLSLPIDDKNDDLHALETEMFAVMSPRIELTPRKGGIATKNRKAAATIGQMALYYAYRKRYDDLTTLVSTVYANAPMDIRKTILTNGAVKIAKEFQDLLYTLTNDEFLVVVKELGNMGLNL